MYIIQCGMFSTSSDYRGQMQWYKMAIAVHPSTLILPFLLVLMSVMVSYTMADAAKDREECAQQLVGLTTCLPYVGGQA